MQEVGQALIENRKPNKALDLTEAENDRCRVISKEITRVNEQIELCRMDFEERHLSVGEAPAAIVRIPTNYDHNAPDFALDAEKFLRRWLPYRRAQALIIILNLIVPLLQQKLSKQGLVMN